MLKPLGDRIVVKIEEKEQTVGGFVLAGASQEKNKRSKCTSDWTRNSYLGMATLLSPAVAVGDTVLIDAHVTGAPKISAMKIIEEQEEIMWFV